ncbi:MAG TPA: hypothetical protein VH023_07935, partial [Rhodopila sp.]|nr:hypothetical protein [Rhodopila sp.]
SRQWFRSGKKPGIGSRPNSRGDRIPRWVHLLGRHLASDRMTHWFGDSTLWIARQYRASEKRDTSQFCPSGRFTREIAVTS